MSVLYIDGFETQSTATLGRRWSINSGSWTIASTGGRNGGAGLVSSGTSARIWQNLPSARERLVVGFAFKLDADVTSGHYRRIAQFVSGGTPGLQVGVASPGILRLSSAASSDLDNVGGTVICEATGTSISAHTWYYVEVSARFASGLAAGECKLYLYGEEVAASLDSATGVGNGGWTAAEAFEFGVAGSSAANVTYDDLYILDPVTGPANFTPRGECRVPAFRPNGDGAHTDFMHHGDAANYNCVNEVSDDADTTYVSSGVVDKRDNYPLGVDFTSGDILVHAVQFVVRARKEGGGDRSIVTSLGTTSGDHDSAVPITLTDSYETTLEIWETDPDNPVFSSGSVAEANFGYKVEA